jgi:hypothetical protein
MKRPFSSFSVVLVGALFAASTFGASQDSLSHYKGTPYHDSHYQGGAMQRPPRPTDKVVRRGLRWRLRQDTFRSIETN